MEVLRVRAIIAVVSGILLCMGAGTETARAQGTSIPERAAAILGRRCLSCHNADKKAGKLDLSARASALRVLSPEMAAQSLLLSRITKGTMPPDGKLPPGEVEALRKWVTGGAVYPREPLEPAHPPIKPLWSFQPVRQPAVPKTKYDALARNPIDRFLFAKLERKGLRPSPPASRLALLRRVTIDLTGLPPTPEESRAFFADKSPNAYEKVVDRLLASPAYGERWGRHWLDVARYGESHGYEQNHLRQNAWPYRDYVIRAFNEDKPYTKFIMEQLAGDLIGKGDPNAEAATGFLVAGIHDTVGNQTEEGTRQQRANDLDDMVTTTGAAFLGLSINCAKCHNHKFDPIPQKDYYRVASVFAGVRHGEREIPQRKLTAMEQETVEQARARLEQIKAEVVELEALAARVVRGQEGQVRLRPAVDYKRNTEEFAPVQARFLRFTVLATTGAEPCLDELQVFGPENDQNLALSANGARATASSLLPGFPIHQIGHLNDGRFGNDHSWISAEPGRGWAQIELSRNTRIHRVVWGRDATGQLKDRLATSYLIEVSENGRDWKTVATGQDRVGFTGKLSPEVLLRAMTPDQQRQHKALSEETERLRSRIAALAPTQKVYAGQFTPPDPVFVLKRGDVMQRLEPASPGALSQIPGLSSELPDRPAPFPRREGGAASTDGKSLPVSGRDLGIGQPPAPDSRLLLARWIGDPKNPLTARVLVNRLWAHHFGKGIVGTPSDFGNMGEPPSHPELLDWLAADFIAHGWRIKRMHRLMVTSAAYRQASEVIPKAAKVDGDNRLLWRMPLRRMEAEAVRDAILQTSGKLDRKMGGPSYQLFAYRVVNVAIYGPMERQGPETWRRCIYQMPARGIRDDLLGTLDCPDSAERAARRTSTTTALQALSLLNGEFVTEQANCFAERVRKEAGTQPEAAVTRAFLQAFGRAPTLTEKKAAQALVAEHGLPTLCRALFNANEFLYY